MRTTALRFYATGYFQMSDGDLMEVNQSNVCRIINRISCCIARRKSNFITSLSGDLTTKQEFYNIARFPSVVGAIDCTHIPIVSPGGDAAEFIETVKFFFSINMQAICDAKRCPQLFRALYVLTSSTLELS